MELPFISARNLLERAEQGIGLLTAGWSAFWRAILACLSKSCGEYPNQETHFQTRKSSLWIKYCN
jgi:hypothetical protein